MVENKTNDEAKVDDEEVVSMNSLGNLHGRVDFFGIETKRANKPIYQKLKVVQTWIFIEALVIVLLTVYLIVLSVWLAPFFPTNYDTDDETDDNTATISSLQSEHSSTQGQVDNNTASIRELQEWRRNHTQQFDEMNAAIRTLQGQASDLQNQTATLNSTVNQLEQEVANLTEQNKLQEARIIALDRRVFDLETTEAARAADSARSAALTGRYHARVKKLECFQESMTNRVDDLDESVQERYCNVTKTIGDVYGQCMDVQKLTSALTARMGSKEAHMDFVNTRLQNLTSSVKELKESNAEEHKEFEQEMSAMQTNFSQRMDERQNQTKFIAKTLHTTIQNQVDRAQWVRESFMEQDDLRAASMEKQRIMHEAGIGKLQCEIDSLNATLHKNLKTCKNTITNMTQDAIYQAHEMVEHAKTKLTGFVDDTKVNMTEEIKKVNSSLATKLDAVETEVGNEIKERELQYVHLCDRIDGVQRSSYENFTTTQVDIKAANDEMQNLTKEIDSMQQQEIAQEGRLSGLNQEVETRTLEFIQFKAETVATDLDLRDQTCLLKEKVLRLGRKQAVHTIRINNSEIRVNDVEPKLTAAILQSEIEFIRQLAGLHTGQTDIKVRTDHLQDAYAQMVADFGGRESIKNLVERTSQISPQMSPPRPVSTHGPEFTDSALTARDSGGTTPLSDSEYSDYSDYSEYEEHEE